MRLLRHWNDQPVWVDRVWLLGVYAIIFAFGTMFGCLRQEWKQSAMAAVAVRAIDGLEQCVTTLDGTGRAAAVLAGTERGQVRWRQAAQRQVRQQPLQVR